MTVNQVPHAGEFPVLPPQEFGDVHDYYRHLREQAPVYQDPNGAYVFTRYDDIFAALSDPVTYSSLHQLNVSPVPEANVRSIVYSDDPDHLDVRQLVNRAFTPRAVGELIPLIDETVADVVGALRPDEPFDVLKVGLDISFRVFADALAVPRESRDRVRKWMVTAAQFVRPQPIGAAGIGQRPFQPDTGVEDAAVVEQRRVFNEGFDDMAEHFRTLVDTHIDHDPKYCQNEEHLVPLARYIVAAVKADPSAMDVVLTRLVPPLHAGGTSTVAHQYPNAIDVLIDHPAIWDAIRDDPSLMDTDRPSDILEEILRLKSVVQGLTRKTTRDVVVRGVHIPAGSPVSLIYVSGSHDAEMFDDAESFEQRGISRHLAFGFGTHSCIGQSFARAQLKSFLSAMVGKFSRLELVTTEPAPKWGGVGVYYTPDRLPVVGRA